MFLLCNQCEKVFVFGESPLSSVGRNLIFAPNAFFDPLMLNRRNLRIKVMQSLFAFHQAREANHQLAFEFVRQRPAPDLNSMETQDKETLAMKSKLAEKALAEAFSNEDRLFEADDQQVREVVDEALTRYDDQCARDKETLRRAMVSEAERIYHHYIAVLSLACAFADVAGADKKVSHTNFQNNSWIRALQRSE